MWTRARRPSLPATLSNSTDENSGANSALVVAFLM